MGRGLCLFVLKYKYISFPLIQQINTKKFPNKISDYGKITVLGGLEELNQWSWYGAIAPIRALLLPPKEYKKMMTLQTHLQEHRRNPEFNFKVRSVTNFIHNTLKIPNMMEEDIATVLAIFDTNAFQVVRTDLNQLVRTLILLMKTAKCHRQVKNLYFSSFFFFFFMHFAG